MKEKKKKKEEVVYSGVLLQSTVEILNVWNGASMVHQGNFDGLMVLLAYCVCRDGSLNGCTKAMVLFTVFSLGEVSLGGWDSRGGD